MLTIRQGNAFGFVDDNFVEPRLIAKSKLADDTAVTGKAVLSFNSKKNQWGWKAVEVKRT
jgi:hypothetical protein